MAAAAAVASHYDGVAAAVDGGAAPDTGASGGGGSLPKTQKKLPFQDTLEKLYNGNAVQIFVAFLIGANFLTNIIEKEIDPGGNKYTKIFADIDLFYNVAFTIELCVNIYAHWFVEFWKSGWNIFDTVVVAIGVINMANLPLPEPFRLLRLMRAFRVFRLFKRVRSLNKIIVAIVHAVPGVMNAFLILAIIMSIYAILAIEFYQDVGLGCKSKTSTLAPGFTSTRKFCVGEEYFGTFSRSIYSFFQVLTGESWSEMIARPMIWAFEDDWIRAVGSSLFFVSYVIVSSFILANVVVAVLLDKMASAEEDEASPDAAEGEDATVAVEAKTTPLTDREAVLHRSSRQLQDTLNTLTARTSSMTTEFDDMKKDLAAMQELLGSIDVKSIGMNNMNMSDADGLQSGGPVKMVLSL